MDQIDKNLLQKYPLTPIQLQILQSIKKAKNMPDIFTKNLVTDEDLIWTIAVSTAKLDPNSNPSTSEIKRETEKAEERVRKLQDAEDTYKWFSLKWNEKLMKKLINNWFCGMLVINPNLTTKDGNPIQFVHEYYGPESNYPEKEDQTDEWKQEVIDLYVLMSRSICKSYPNATIKGIVSFSDMQHFDWSKYDMETKQRNAGINYVIPSRLARMIAIKPDEKMQKYYNDMSPRIRKWYGFVQYADFDEAMSKEVNNLPDRARMPKFVGGEAEIDLLESLKYLFREESESLSLMLETYEKMVKNDEIPKHREV